MINIRLSLVIFIFFLAGFIYSDAADSKNEANISYRVLREKFNNWDSALYGVRGYHRRRLYYLLVDLIGNEIATETDYRISLPDVIENRYYNSDLYNTKWLHIHGSTDLSSITAITEKGPGYIKEVERNKYLFSLSGRVKKFMIVESCTGRTVHLFLESVKLHMDF